MQLGSLQLATGHSKEPLLRQQLTDPHTPAELHTARAEPQSRQVWLESQPWIPKKRSSGLFRSINKQEYIREHAVKTTQFNVQMHN